MITSKQKALFRGAKNYAVAQAKVTSTNIAADGESGVLCKRLSAEIRFRRLWWSLLVATCLREGVCLPSGAGGAPRNERSEFWG